MGLGGSSQLHPFRTEVKLKAVDVVPEVGDGPPVTALRAVKARKLTVEAHQLQVLLDHALSGIRVVGQSFWVHNDTVTLLSVGFAPVSCENAESFSAGIFGFRIFPEGPVLATAVQW